MRPMLSRRGGRRAGASGVLLLLGAAPLLALALAGCSRPAARLWREPATGMGFVLVPAGRFRMGSEPGEAGRQPDEAAHEVEITRPFYLGRYEVTQAEWVRLMGTNPSRFPRCGPRCPVETVSYDDVQVYIARLTRVSGSGRFRLPTEAEWEYACRAGTTTRYHSGEDPETLARAGNTVDASAKKKFPQWPSIQGDDGFTFTAPVGRFKPNAFGLYDMHGNAWEWCADWYGDYPRGPVRDPRGPARAAARRVGDARGGAWGWKRVIRGGSWYFNGESCRSALRYTHAPADKGFSLGFRLVREVDGGPLAG